MAALFSKPSSPKVPKISDEEVAEERRKQLALRKSKQGLQSTILTGGAGLSDPILGTAASLVGGIL